MKLKHGYLLAGVFWALFLAPIVAFGAIGWFAGVLWLYVFGDSPWPAATEPALLVIGIGVFFSVAACCIYLADRHGRRREATVDADTKKERRRVFVLGTAPLVLIAITVFFQYQRSVDRAEVRAVSQQQETAFEDLLNVRHGISELVIGQTDDGDWAVHVSTIGERNGAYRLHWTVNAMIYGEVLSGDVHDVDLDAESDALAFSVPRNELAIRYRDDMLNGNGGGVLVDEPFELVVTLIPEFDADAVEKWPAPERRRWENGGSQLRSIMTRKFPVQFRVEYDGAIRFPTP